MRGSVLKGIWWHTSASKLKRLQTQAIADAAVKVSSWFGAKTNNDAA